MGIRRGWPGDSTAARPLVAGAAHGGHHSDIDDTSDDAHRGDPGAGHRRAIAGRVRPAVPTGRAALGALLVVAAAVGTLQLARSAARTPSTRFATVRHAVGPGTVLRRADLRLAPVRLPAAQAQGLVGDLALLDGAVTLGPLGAGELVQRAAVVRKVGGPSSRELSFAVEPSRAAGGRVRGGDRVDVIATFGAGADARSELVAAGVLVVHTDLTGSAIAGRGALTVTLAVDDADVALAVAHAASAADLTVVRTTGVLPATTAASPATRPSEGAR